MKMVINEQLEHVFNTFPTLSREYIVKECFDYIVISITKRLFSFKNISVNGGFMTNITDSDFKIKIIHGIRFTLFEETIYRCMDGVVYLIMDYIRKNKLISKYVAISICVDGEKIDIKFKCDDNTRMIISSTDINVNEILHKPRKELEISDCVYLSDNIYHSLILDHLTTKLNLNYEYQDNGNDEQDSYYANGKRHISFMSVVQNMYKEPQKQYEILDTIFTRVFDKYLDNLVILLKKDYSKYLINGTTRLNIVDYGHIEKDYHLVISHYVK